jgi:hypothetical protein
MSKPMNKFASRKPKQDLDSFIEAELSNIKKDGGNNDPQANEDKFKTP